MSINKNKYVQRVVNDGFFILFFCSTSHFSIVINSFYRTLTLHHKVGTEHVMLYGFAQQKRKQSINSRKTVNIHRELFRAIKYIANNLSPTIHRGVKFIGVS